MTTSDLVGSLRVLARALDQAGDVLDHVAPDRLSRTTPCADWDVAALADHLVEAPRRFLAMVRGEQPDWGSEPPHVVEGWGPAFRVAADDLIHAWHERAGDVALPPVGMQVAELATHTWDLATALGQPPAPTLDPEIAEVGLAFMQEALEPEMRGAAFGPEQTPPTGADAYERLAAFAGRVRPL
ncbi:TIGR03086 family metal-binding protein [Nocardioides sp. DS6]|uniref:TIGR03086 family metal-binding protein n=1 Tax=Nocardioides eburneus TaxID=3231482 RepID=A0ABV3T269_9ACTN